MINIKGLFSKFLKRKEEEEVYDNLYDIFYYPEETKILTRYIERFGKSPEVNISRLLFGFRCGYIEASYEEVPPRTQDVIEKIVHKDFGINNKIIMYASCINKIVRHEVGANIDFFGLRGKKIYPSEIIRLHKDIFSHHEQYLLELKNWKKKSKKEKWELFRKSLLREDMNSLQTIRMINRGVNYILPIRSNDFVNKLILNKRGDLKYTLFLEEPVGLGDIIFPNSKYKVLKRLGWLYIKVKTDILEKHHPKEIRNILKSQKSPTTTYQRNNLLNWFKEIESNKKIIYIEYKALNNANFRTNLLLFVKYTHIEKCSEFNGWARELIQDLRTKTKRKSSKIRNRIEKSTWLPEKSLKKISILDPILFIENLHTILLKSIKSENEDNIFNVLDNLSDIINNINEKVSEVWKIVLYNRLCFSEYIIKLSKRSWGNVEDFIRGHILDIIKYEKNRVLSTIDKDIIYSHLAISNTKVINLPNYSFMIPFSGDNLKLVKDTIEGNFDVNLEININNKTGCESNKHVVMYIRADSNGTCEFYYPWNRKYEFPTERPGFLEWTFLCYHTHPTAAISELKWVSTEEGRKLQCSINSRGDEDIFLNHEYYIVGAYHKSRNFFYGFRKKEVTFNLAHHMGNIPILIKEMIDYLTPLKDLL